MVAVTWVTSLVAVPSDMVAEVRILRSLAYRGNGGFCSGRVRPCGCLRCPKTDDTLDSVLKWETIGMDAKERFALVVQRLM